MSNKERFKEIKNSMGYIVKDGQYYRFRCWGQNHKGATPFIK